MIPGVYPLPGITFTDKTGQSAPHFVRYPHGATLTGGMPGGHCCYCKSKQNAEICVDICITYYAIIGSGFVDVNSMACNSHGVIVFRYGLMCILNLQGFKRFSVGAVRRNLWLRNLHRIRVNRRDNLARLLYRAQIRVTSIPGP